MRGEQGWWDPESYYATGPSPRARGAVGPAALLAGQRGTIPACAGSRAQQAAAGVAGLDHPRVRGEQFDVPAPEWVSEGPSPRARGADRPDTILDVPYGTIPACAGSRLADLQVYLRIMPEFITSFNLDISGVALSSSAAVAQVCGPR